MSEYIKTALTDGVFTVTMNRPDKYNSFVREMALAMQKALEEADEKPEVRCVILVGAGKAFCSGQDLGDGGSAASLDLERTLRDE